MLCVNGKVDESGKICLLTFEENSSRRMRELGLSFFIVIVVLDVSQLRKIGLAQYGAVEPQLWVINWDWVLTDPVG